MSVTCKIKDYNLVKKKLDDMQKAPRKVMQSLTSEAKKRVPGWVSTEVTKEYGIKKAEITGKKVGKLKIKGRDFRNLKFEYTGRLLTPTHFSMTPTAPKADGGSYTLKATIVKGQRATLGKVKKLTKKQRAALTKNLTREGSQNSDHSPIMLMRAKGGQYLPFQRKSTNRKDIEAIKTVSLPQMINYYRVRQRIQETMSWNLQKRLDHHLKRYMEK